VASAKAAKVSIIKFTHNICTGVKIDYLIKGAHMKTVNTATTLIVS